MAPFGRTPLIHGLFLAALALPGAGAAQEDDTPLGGVGRLACSQVLGVENVIQLGEVADWALGYMAGRLDAGQTVVDGAEISPADGVDVITGIAQRCRETPDAAVVTAVRDVAQVIYGEAAQGGKVVADPPPPEPDLPPPPGSEAPPPRPEGLVDVAETDETPETTGVETADASGGPDGETAEEPDGDSEPDGEGDTASEDTGPEDSTAE